MSELILFGDSVKALDDSGRVGGLGIVFSSPADPDVSRDRDFFTKNTDFDLEPGEKRTVLYSHGFDKALGKRKLGRATYESKDAGIWFETQLALRDDYEKKIFELAKAGKLGWSTGSAPHLVERKRVGDANEILSWPVVEVSLTPTPAEPRTSALTIKGFQELLGIDEPLAGQSFADELQSALAAVQSGVIRAKDLRDIRVKEGRTLSQANRERLSMMADRMMELHGSLTELLDSSKPMASEEEVMGVLARYQLLQLQGV